MCHTLTHSHTHTRALSRNEGSADLKSLPIRPGSYIYYHVIEHGSIYTREGGGGPARVQDRRACRSVPVRIYTTIYLSIYLSIYIYIYIYTREGGGRTCTRSRPKSLPMRRYSCARFSKTYSFGYLFRVMYVYGVRIQGNVRIFDTDFGPPSRPHLRRPWVIYVYVARTLLNSG